jgi:hypothetical protein
MIMMTVISAENPVDVDSVTKWCAWVSLAIRKPFKRNVFVV